MHLKIQKIHSEHVSFNTRRGRYDEVHYSFEKGGPYYTGNIAETYKKGQEIEALIKVRIIY